MEKKNVMQDKLVKYNRYQYPLLAFSSTHGVHRAHWERRGDNPLRQHYRNHSLQPFLFFVNSNAKQSPTRGVREEVLWVASFPRRNRTASHGGDRRRRSPGRGICCPLQQSEWISPGRTVSLGRTAVGLVWFLRPVFLDYWLRCRGIYN